MNQTDDIVRILQALDSPEMNRLNFPLSRNQSLDISDQEVLGETDNPLELIDLNGRRNAVKETTWH